MKVWAYLFRYKVKSIISAFKKHTKTRIVYLAIGEYLHPFPEELDRQWNSMCFCVDDSPPKIPYAKVRMTILELNEKYDYERKQTP